MLCANSYTKDYINACRARLDQQVSAYNQLVAAASKPGAEGASVDRAVKEFEPHFFNNMVLALENYFVHRARGKEGKDGNPLNEVRMLSASLMSHGGRMCADKTIKYDPARSVLHCKIGEEIRATEPGFKALSSAFFADIEAKYL